MHLKAVLACLWVVMAGLAAAPASAQGAADAATAAAEPAHAPDAAGSAPQPAPPPEVPQPPAPPPPPRAPVAMLGEGELRPAPPVGVFVAGILPDPAAAELPVVGPGVTGPEAMTLRRLVAEGRAAGHAGLFYDNRDRGHSRLSPERFPQFTHIAYAPELDARELNRGLAGPFLFGAPVLGNASMAVTGGAQARSLPRLAMTTVQGPRLAFVGYVNNHLYVYPAHRDVAASDVLPAGLPYFAVSRGSSGSDQPLLNGLALALAAFTPETRARLEEARLLAPTLTMILRRSLAGVTDYLSPEAHPPAIEGQRVRPGVMLSAAQALTPDAIPPLVRLRVMAEDFSEEAGLADQNERLFDTPSAVARLWRDWSGRREMLVSAAATEDPNGRPLQFHWVLLSGDPERVRIAPADAAGSSARITLDWHDAPFAAQYGARPTSRVEIAVIAWNGVQYSAPALISVAFPAHEAREYAPGPDGTPRLVSVDYDAAGRDVAFDPVLWWTAAWRDVPVFDAGDRIIGWRRMAGEERWLITPMAPGGYSLEGRETARPRLVWTP